MTGLIHLRAVTAIFLFPAMGAVVPPVLTVYYFHRINWMYSLSLTMGIIMVAIAIWLTRGSNIARYILIILFGLVALQSAVRIYLTAQVASVDAMVEAVIILIDGYCLWALALSKKLRAELALRRAANKIKDREERKRFYAQGDPAARREAGVHNE